MPCQIKTEKMRLFFLSKKNTVFHTFQFTNLKHSKNVLEFMLKQIVNDTKIFTLTLFSMRF